MAGILNENGKGGEAVFFSRSMFVNWAQSLEKKGVQSTEKGN
jgi:hypothetical protein